VIVTTNFDRLIEQACESAGISPAVISTADAVEGALPISHSRCTIVKLHGDYLDTRIKNTESELASYDPRLDQFLDRIFDEFGVIVCGWSGEWDSALRSALERCKSRRLPMYWASRGEPKDAANRLISLRGAEKIGIESADAFFVTLREKVIALQDFDRPHPLSARVGVATVKRYLEDGRQRIALRDLIARETERVYAEITPKNRFPTGADAPTDTEVQRRIGQYDSQVGILAAMVATGCYWGGHESVWSDSLRRIANIPEDGGGYLVWLAARYYPALVILYAGGLGAIASQNYSALRALLEVKVRESDHEESVTRKVNTQIVLSEGARLLRPGVKTPVSDHLHAVLREPLLEYLPDDREYDRCFDVLEYVVALVYVDDFLLQASQTPGAPVGRFWWRRDVVNQLGADIDKDPTNWPILKAGLFGASGERLRKAKAVVHDVLARLSPW